VTTASPMNVRAPEPVPGGWYGAELARDPASWRVPLPGEVCDDMLRAAEELRRDGISLDPVHPRPEMSERTRSLVADLYRRLSGEPGMVLLTGFPVDEAPELTETAYLVLGMLLGQPVAQEVDGRLLSRVEQSAKSATNIANLGALPFHIDPACDVIGLLCIRSASAGGRSLLMSSRQVHNLLLERHPELLPILYQPIPVSVPPLRGPDGDSPQAWCLAPLFSRAGGHFSCYCTGYFLKGTPPALGAPPYTDRQRAAADALNDVTATPDLALEMTFQPGDLQLINNMNVLHSRTAYTYDPTGQGRLLLRQHLAFGGSPELPDDFTVLYGTTAAGTYRGGWLRTPELGNRFGTPLHAP
jgi:TfdA family taurine catabolism dioxygenase TauD